MRKSELHPEKRQLMPFLAILACQGLHRLVWSLPESFVPLSKNTPSGGRMTARIILQMSLEDGMLVKTEPRGDIHLGVE